MRRIPIIAFLLLCSCSVKENRSVCPCDLLVKPAQALLSDGWVVVSVVQDGVVVKQEMLSREEFESGECKITVSRKPSTVTVFTGITSMNLLRGRTLDISYSKECDELFSSSDNAELHGDSFEYPVSLHKNFARLYLTVLNPVPGSEMSINGTVAGYDLMDAAPCQGDFIWISGEKDAAQGCCIRLPRQLDNSLSLKMDFEGETIRILPLGALIAASGYSFADEDLKDITMTVDMEKSYAKVGVADWNEVEIPLIDY